MSLAVSRATAAVPSGSAVRASGVVAVLRVVARAVRRRSGTGWLVGDVDLSEREFFFAMVQRPESPGGHSLALMPGLYLAFDVAVLDRIIETEPARARFVAGLVAWREGELAAEIEAGAWYVLKPDAALVMRDPDGLWEELVRRSQLAENAI